MWQTEVESLYQSICKEKGDDIQKLSVIETLPQLLAEDAHSCITQVLPKIHQSLPTASPEFHMAAAVVFKQVLEQRLVSHSTFTEVFLQSILSSLDHQEPAIAHAWMGTILDVIEILPVDIIRREILPMAINEGKLSQTVSSRITCCRLMGKIATRFDSASLRKEILPTVQSLCQDINNDVRACICLQLRYVAQNIGSDIMKLLPFVIELASDEGSNVRKAAIQTIAYLLPMLQPDIIKDVMIPLIKVSCENAMKAEDDVLGAIAEEFGRIAETCDTYLTPAEKTWFIKYFIQISQLGVSSVSAEPTKHEFSFNMGNNSQVTDKALECRRCCALHISSMLHFTSSVPEGINTLLPAFRYLANDSNYVVRSTIASSLHQIINVLGSKSGLIKADILKLLIDNHEEVAEGLIPHISEILDRLLYNQVIGVNKAEVMTIDLGKALIKCENKISSTHNWRLSVQILDQFEVLPKYFSSDFIYTYLVPIVSNRILYSRPLPVRLAAGKTLLVFLRYNLNVQQRIDIRNRFCTDIARSPNCYMRMLYIRIMIEGMSIFSSVYFKENFCPTLLSLMEDPIANVRYKIITLVPKIKSSLRLPADKKLLHTLETNLRNLMNNEKDRDVSAELVKVASQMDSIEVRIDSQPSPTKMSRYNAEDMKKFEEEKKLEGMLTKKISISAGNYVKKRPNSKPTVARNISTEGTSASSSRLSFQSMNNELTKSSSSQKPPLMRQNAIANRQTSDSKPSTSTDNLTSKWSRLTSNNPRLIKPWERTSFYHSHTNLASTNPSCSFNESLTQKEQCSCHELVDRILLTHPFTGFPKEVSHPNLSECSYVNDTKPCRPTHFFPTKPDYNITNLAKSSSITNVRERKHDLWQDLVLTPSSSVEKYKLPNFTRHQTHCNPYWSFSSMPKIPITLVDDEFMVDAGIRMPSQLVSVENSSRIPNPQDIAYGNKKVKCIDQMRRCGSTFGSSRRFSVDYEGIGDSMLTPSLSSGLQNKMRFGFELNDGKFLDDQTKRSFAFPDQNAPKSQQPKNIDDKNKRHFTSYSMKLSDTKESKPKFKRHSMEMPHYNVSDRTTAGQTMKRFSTLDVNHNQGSSKIPVRNVHSSGSRTAPVTRTSSPIRVDPELLKIAGYSNAPTYLHNGRLRRFHSSDEEIEELCQKF